MNATLLVLAWKIAGWLGLDHRVLSPFGSPWRPGKVFESLLPDMATNPATTSKVE